jgi:hypothetical protein
MALVLTPQLPQPLHEDLGEQAGKSPVRVKVTAVSSSVSAPSPSWRSCSSPSFPATSASSETAIAYG